MTTAGPVLAVSTVQSGDKRWLAPQPFVMRGCRPVMGAGGEHGNGATRDTIVDPRSSSVMAVVLTVDDVASQSHAGTPGGRAKRTRTGIVP